ncbi:MAG: dethiobiotin synthase [Alphaproteobacteria bacterium]
MTPWFVSATGTDVGKTYALCSLLQALRDRGARVCVLKPVLSGFTADDLAATDSGRLLAAAGQAVTPENVARITPWRFVPPLSPDMAAQRAGVTISLGEVKGFCTASMVPGAIHFVEGAGGIMSPLGSDFLNVDLVQALDARVLLVAGGYLGTISHTLTALAALAQRGIRPGAVVLSGFQAGPVSLEETQASIMRYTDVPVFCVGRGAGVPAALVEMVRAG